MVCRCAPRRLCPTYATDINSPLRHVRTRIYFTSESHVHSLINVLRFAQLGAQQRCTRAAAWPTQPRQKLHIFRSVLGAGACGAETGVANGSDCWHDRDAML